MYTTRLLRIWTVKLVCIIMPALLIPNVAALITNSRYSKGALVLSYSWFIVSSLAITKASVLLTSYVKSKLEWRYHYFYKIFVTIFGVNIVFTGLVTALCAWAWRLFSFEQRDNNLPLLNTVVFAILSAVFIAETYEIVLLNLERTDNISRVEQLNVAKAQAELEALKNQIDPHFIFNSLNTLSFLIVKDPQNAKLFNDTLAKVYRYILGNKDKDLVLLREEVEFISNYFYLLKIRFREAVNMEIEFNDLSAEDFLIPPISLQALVENAIKHNDFSDKNPLTIHVAISSNYIVVRNAMHPKTYNLPSSRIGLNNLDNRYKLITNRNIVIENNTQSFSVRLPVLKFNV